ncbi:MAG TPA: DHA2 family efflux MFS transporter permease subunit, partial [Actinospica sp.]|nr:DHA2 family efflux MFS transporter permease subunit [Actinospica sp.]
MTTDQSPSAARGGPDRVSPELWWLCGILMVGAFAALLDGSIVNVAIDTLTTTFHSTLPTVQWVITGYLLALCVSIPVSGWAMERFGPKRVWIVAQAIFLLGSVLSGAAWSDHALIAFRVLQGLGGGLIMPVGQALLAQSAPRAQLTRLMGLVSVPVMVAPVVGPALGGVVIDDMGWRWIFYLNVPLCLAVMALSVRRIADPVARTPRRLDLTGLALLTPGLVALLYGLSEAGSSGGFGGTASVTGISVGLALLVASTVHALRGPASSRLLDLRLLRRRYFTAGTAASFVLSAAMYGALIMMPLYFQTLRGDSAMKAGLLLVPQGVGYVIAVGIVGKVAERIGVRAVTLIGVTLAVGGTIPFALSDAHTSEAMLGAALFVRGFGFGSS